MQEELKAHYGRLLGLESPWEVASVDLDMEGQRVEIALTRSPGGPVRCPGCGGECAIRDHSPERAWRHLDTMQFETRLKARVPRGDCPGCGVRTVEVPWAGKHGRFTLMFEAFAIAVLRAASSVDAACGLLRIHWSTAAAIMRWAVGRGLERRGEDPVKHLGIDESKRSAAQIACRRQPAGRAKRGKRASAADIATSRCSTT